MVTMSEFIKRVGLVSCCFALFACTEKIEGSGEITSEVRTVDAFTEVTSDNKVNVELTMVEDGSDPVDLTLRADDNLLEYIETDVAVGQLRINAPRQLRPTEPMLLTGLVERMSKIEADNEAEIRVAYLIEDNVQIDADNDARVEIEGEGRRVDINADNDARVDLRAFGVDVADVEIEDGAEVHLCVFDEVDGTVEDGILRVACGGDFSEVMVSGNGIVLPF